MRKNLWDQHSCFTYIFAGVIIAMGCLYTAMFIDSIVNLNDQAMVNSSCE